MNFSPAPELGACWRVVGSVYIKTRDVSPMFYVYDLANDQRSQSITIDPRMVEDLDRVTTVETDEVSVDNDIDFVDDALLNTAPHNRIEQQLLRGDVIGLALMSGAVLWTAMGAFG